jgi:hypothetical protein
MTLADKIPFIASHAVKGVKQGKESAREFVRRQDMGPFAAIGALESVADSAAKALAKIEAMAQAEIAKQVTYQTKPSPEAAKNCREALIEALEMAQFYARRLEELDSRPEIQEVAREIGAGLPDFSEADEDLRRAEVENTREAAECS